MINNQNCKELWWGGIEAFYDVPETKFSEPRNLKAVQQPVFKMLYTRIL